jgi:hypothetical protein
VLLSDRTLRVGLLARLPPQLKHRIGLQQISPHLPQLHSQIFIVSLQRAVGLQREKPNQSASNQFPTLSSSAAFALDLCSFASPLPVHIVPWSFALRSDWR